MAPGSGSKRKADRSSNGRAESTDMSAGAEALNVKLSRKRTKTGCLTCRKRRIKCGEERPTCRNCTKSKRICEGYSQRVVFKPPNSFDFRQVAANGAAHITFPSDFGQPVIVPFQQGFPSGPLDGAHHVNFQHGPAGHYEPGRGQLDPQINHFGHQYVNHMHHFQAGQMQAFPAGFVPPPGYHPQPAVNGMPQQYHPLVGQAPQYPVQPSPTYSSHPPEPITPAFTHVHGQLEWQQPYTQANDSKWQHSSPTTSATVERISPTSARSSTTVQGSVHIESDNVSPSWSTAHASQYETVHNFNYQYPDSTNQRTQQQPLNRSAAPVNHVTPECYEQEQQQFQDSESPNTFLAQAAVETQDDDYYDVQSDEEMEMETSLLSAIDLERQKALHTILQLNNISIQDLQTRRYDTFIYDGILTHYKAEEAASPLRNPATARVFAHFISVTGPSLSIYERHPRNTSVLFTDGQIPFSQQGLWTYTMPMAALHHQGLLHAMLALASLHIARLQGASLTPSMQHYAWSLKRIHSCVSDAKKRYNITTIAATMLLGFYEVMTADHTKWNMHLAGSKQLFLETDFSTLAQQFRQLKAEREPRRKAGRKKKQEAPQANSQDEILDQIYDVDERMISELAGKKVRYDEPGRIVTMNSKIPPKLDLRRFEILKDLYWWYLKQDAYQSIISGNPLLLDYSRWSNCPPRAPLGRAEAVYGSFDHLILLLGRVADFAARDRHRKLKQMEANGGHWIPPPAFRQQMPPQQGPPPTPVSATNAQPIGTTQFAQPPNPGPPPTMPQFYGMAPPPRDDVRMPSSYFPSNSIPTPDTASPRDFNDLPALKAAAMEEYGRIRAALHTFENSLGDAFLPLSSDFQPPMDTPFGPAMFYRSYDIGCLWAIYHMAVIIAMRSQPDMHPAAHAAAAILAQDTKHHANTIGRIAAGIVPGPPEQPLNPTLGSSLCESCMPSFFAAVQYQDGDQRVSTVRRIFSIAQRTGWGSAELIAHGCETAWVKAAQAGRGPPYERQLRERQSDDPRKNGSWEHVDSNSAPDQTNEADRRFVTVKPTARLTWAIGIMGTEADEKLNIMN